MNILIIGSDSFIGGCFIRTYEKVHNLRYVSRISTGLTNEFVVENLFEIPESLFDSLDTVINFTAIVHKPDINNKKVYEEINNKLVLNIANKAKTKGVSQFIQMSTIAVYGNQSNISVDTPCNPETLYGLSKLHADVELVKLIDESFSVAIIRPPMVYGGGLAPGNMLRLIKLADTGFPLPFKDVENRRDFINIHNLVQYLALTSEKKVGGIFLISDNEPVSTEYLLHLIYKYLQKKERMFKLPSFVLSLFKLLRSSEYVKLFGSMLMEANFPLTKSVNNFTVEHGIMEMVNKYLEIKS